MHKTKGQMHQKKRRWNYHGEEQKPLFFIEAEA